MASCLVIVHTAAQKWTHKDTNAHEGGCTMILKIIVYLARAGVFALALAAFIEAGKGGDKT